jgi:preprotein translocase subunit SecA
MDEQRKRVYGFRQKILDGANCRALIMEMFHKRIDKKIDEALNRDYGPGRFAALAAQKLRTEFEARDFRGLDFESAQDFARDRAERAAETTVQDAIDSNLPGDENDEEDRSEWNWEVMAKVANAAWGLSLNDRQLKKLGRDQIGEFLLEQAREAIQKVDLSDGKDFLAPDFPHRDLAQWVRDEFGVELDVKEVQKREAAGLKSYFRDRVHSAYDRKEIEYPVTHLLNDCVVGQGPQNVRLDRERLIGEVRNRFDAEIDLDQLKSKQRDELWPLLVELSERRAKKADAAIKEVEQWLDKLFGGAESGCTARAVAGSNGQLDSLSSWLDKSLKTKLSAAEIGELDRAELEDKMLAAVGDRYHPEMREMEQLLLLDQVDSNWKTHLLVMDHLRSSVGLVGYAQVDPKVEYKREGMKLFEQMWNSIHTETTKEVYKVVYHPRRRKSAFVETSARHDAAPGATEEFRQQSSSGSQSADARPEPIRNRGERVGRNDPCPCGSGKKYKNCCMRNRGAIV